MIEINKEIVNSWCIILLKNGHRIFCKVKRYGEGILITETDHVEKLKISNVKDIQIILDSDLEQVKLSFGLRY